MPSLFCAPPSPQAAALLADMKKWVRQRLANFISSKCGSSTASSSSQRDIMLGVSSSPTRVLPPELLAKIFIQCFDTDIFDFSPVQKNPPLYLAQICRLWRSIALSTPQLWAEIPLLRDIPRHNKKKNITFLEQYLKRSNSCPLSVHLATFPPTSKASRRPLNASPVLSVAIMNSHRWKKATVTTDFEGFCQLNQLSLPTLEQLFLMFYEHGTDPASGAVSGSVVNQNEYLQLSGLVISSISGTSEALNPVLSQLVTPLLHELRIFQFQDFTPNLVTNIQRLVLQSGCNLLRLDLRNFSGSSPSHNPGDLARLLAQTPLLQDLHISPIEAVDLERLCLHINEIHDPLVPSLRHLQIQSVRDTIIDLPVLSKLGLSRCDFSMKMADGTMVSLRNHGCRLLETLTYEPYLDNQRLDHQEVLEGILLVETDERLALNRRFWEQKPFCGSPFVLLCHHQVDTTELDAYFTLLETYPIPGPDFFQTTRIHLYLQDVKVGLLQWSPDHNFAQRAKKILEKWEPMLMDCLPKRRWAMDGQVLRYVPLNSDIRESRQALGIIFGM
ncbi:hypothetical protein BDQ17DRAFT_1410312 [Cyathus striatus]|nr:hypothetical protein BDQ17DRAFT_1410312 [Cyathus striatus]